MKALSKKHFEAIEKRIKKWDNSHDDKEIFMLIFGAIRGDQEVKKQLLTVLKKIGISVKKLLLYCRADAQRMIKACNNDKYIAMQEEGFLKKLEECLRAKA